jgi:hypothetical protein
MRVIIAGSRGFTSLDYEVLEEACLSSGYWFTTIISGGARGVDTLGELFAQKHRIPVERYPAKWDQHGRSAGHLRNLHMGAKVKADALVALWDGESRGTKDMIDIARANRLLVYVRVAVPVPPPIPGPGSSYRPAGA